MTTRLELRTSLRERLEDTGSAPLWSDAALNDWLSQAMRLYGAQIPMQATAETAAVTAGAIAVALPVGVVAESVAAVRNAAGATVGRCDDREPGFAPGIHLGGPQGWQTWGTTLRLRRAAAGSSEIGAWSIDHASGRELVGNDIDAQPVVTGDEPIVVALAAALALERRAVEFAKRGDGAGARATQGVAESARADATRWLAARRRQVRAGFLQVDGA